MLILRVSRLKALVGLDIDRLDLHSGFSSQIDREAKLSVGVGGNNPGQRRQLCRGAAAGRTNSVSPRTPDDASRRCRELKPLPC